MNKYTELSDFDINKKVASYELLCDYNINEHKNSIELTCSLGDNNDEYFVYGEFDPCNNPTNAMPIIIENNISLCAPHLREGWMAEYTASGDDVNDGFQADYFDAHNKNPLRSAMEVFLMMKDAENEKV